MLRKPSGGCQFARVGEVTAVERAHLAGQQGDNGYRLAGQSHELHFKALAAVVDMDYRADATRLRPFVRGVSWSGPGFLWSARVPNGSW